MQFKVLVGIIAVYDNKLLIIQRSSTAKYKPGNWTFVCGHLNYGESLRDAVQRELKEEVSLGGDILGIVGTNEWIWHEEKKHHLQINYIVKANSNVTVLDESCQSFKWVDKNNKKEIETLDEFNMEMYKQYTNSVFI
jgi:ADP-ribose pyrophosphatase YjhB (NUDIX family)